VHATVFPNGCALGATWSKETLKAVGEVLGIEARGVHNGLLNEDPSRSIGCNGCGLTLYRLAPNHAALMFPNSVYSLFTLYSPNLNLARDPRWGRAQVIVTPWAPRIIYGCESLWKICLGPR
jgi:beta-glucosidase